ncbi:folylpolyglutamate synthase/dihydrofolate synthase family protein [Clostridium sp.]|uniref:folylpolyglutamate synthase/dihydrofolate synthase family protein n=1 Tax=Clostridium sp. TaxID=1506 RepID=UPI0034644127
MTYKEAMMYINSVGKFGSNYGLERTERILELLGNPHKKIKTIHIAGTNGKGSTTAIISRILIESGYKVAMYTSPFIEEFEERMQINEENIKKERLAKIITKVKKAVDIVSNEGLGHPTEFEIITCGAFLYFYEEKVDYGVIEVGLGGRLDSTNVLTPLVSVITSISYDHINILGDNIKDIAKEKAGIIKDNVDVVVYPNNKEVMEVIELKAKEKNSNVIKIENHMCSFKEVIIDREKVKQLVEFTILNERVEEKLGLLGLHQCINAQVAIKAIEVLVKKDNLHISKETISKALSNVIWKGRLEILNNKPAVVIDGAHNMDGIRKLKSNIDKYFRYNKLILILGILADKDVEDMVKTITPMAHKVIAVTPHSDRAKLAEELKNHIYPYNNNVMAIEDYREAYEVALKESSKEDLILISGSLYMIGDMRKIIRSIK